MMRLRRLALVVDQAYLQPGAPHHGGQELGQQASLVQAAVGAEAGLEALQKWLFCVVAYAQSLQVACRPADDNPEQLGLPGAPAHAWHLLMLRTCARRSLPCGWSYCVALLCGPYRA